MFALLAKDVGESKPYLTVVHTIDEITAHLAHGWRHARSADVTWQHADAHAPKPATDKK